MVPDLRPLLLSIWLLLGLLLQPAESPATEQHLIIGTSYKVLLSTTEQNGLLDTIAKEAFARLGITIELPFLPAERSLLAANSGIHDGELNRIAGLESIYPNLVMVTEPMMDFHFVGFTTGRQITLSGWDDLSPYRVGLIKGWKILEEHVTDLPRVIFVNSAEQLFSQLALGRIDIALYGEMLGRAQLHTMGIDQYAVLKPPLASRKMYMYLHKQHQRLVAPLAEALRALKEDGTYAAIVRDKTAAYRN